MAPLASPYVGTHPRDGLWAISKKPTLEFLQSIESRFDRGDMANLLEKSLRRTRVVVLFVLASSESRREMSISPEPSS